VLPFPPLIYWWVLLLYHFLDLWPPDPSPLFHWPSSGTLPPNVYDCCAQPSLSFLRSLRQPHFESFPNCIFPPLPIDFHAVSKILFAISSGGHFPPAFSLPLAKECLFAQKHVNSLSAWSFHQFSLRGLPSFFSLLELYHALGPFRRSESALTFLLLRFSPSLRPYAWGKIWQTLPSSPP